MKKLTKLLLCLLTFSLIAASAVCFSSCDSESEVILNVYNWGEYISDGEDDSLNVNAEFEKYFNENLSDKYGYKVKINYTTYSSNEELYAKLKNTNTSYDVIIPSDYLVALLIREDMLHKLDFENIPNFGLIDEAYIDGNYYDPTNEYSIPYTMGKVGIIYNTSLIEDEIDSWSALWNEGYSDAGILQFNNSRDAFGTAMFKLGIDVNTTDKALWDKAHEEMIAQRPLVYSFVMDEIFNIMQSGEASIGAYYAGDYFTMMEDQAEDVDLQFYYPEHTNMFIDAMCIPSCAQNKELAEIFINYMLSEEAAVANAEYTYYASPNSLVYENETYIEDMGEDTVEILYPEFEDFAAEYNKYAYRTLDADMLSYLNGLWETVKVN